MPPVFLNANTSSTSMEEYPALRDLLSLAPSEWQRAAPFFLRVFDNILSDPSHSNPKLRRLNLSSGSLISCMDAFPGTLELLFQVGFQEDSVSNEHLFLPPDSPVQPLSFCRIVLAQEAARRETSACTAPPPAVVAVERDEPSAAMPAPSLSQQATREGCLRMLHMMTSHIRQVQQYQNPRFQVNVMNTVPVARLTTESARLLSAFPHQPGMLRTAFLYTLLRWFKTDFFTWVNQPPCEHCHSSATSPLPPGHSSAHSPLPTPTEAQFGASRVEIYLCQQCAGVTRFPRYNNPSKLLETRRGRCGEWANCFTGICVALGYEARWVMDDADHVWTEVWSEEEERWMHCDACETAFDQPLLYESGWGKKLGHVLAFSKDEVADVSWRYSADHTAMRRRRVAIPEVWLRTTLKTLNGQLQRPLSAERKAVLWKRRWDELSETLFPRSAKDSEKTGRNSGSLAWRLARGETGDGGAERSSFVIRPNEKEVANKRLLVSYNCARDQYTRADQTLSGFGSLMFEQENILRKEEDDWKKTYLARLPGTAIGRIVWKISCADSGLSIKSVSLQTNRTVFHSGQVSVSLAVSDHSKTDIPEVYSQTFLSDSVTKLEICVQLTGGDGESAWQHAQLFRQDFSDPHNAFVLDVRFY
ncbi:peptide-N(4)-(N-acetyl-beta-glucosaminyl)asparagine amidase-like [Paramacrobiotus metropolitanus]|uniref:peptide-N(4)-(N-acetyl-beta- glucosaminyl)asparagine amidase-like n=1 Tax=Paramacrobiotus metropolitanus TaxID=2943436 RepID=UPI002445A9A6|nr:peptide-N(4)-(N-acetyl-beta-glucosaminyl)asparagine amidase-like [Paramacrobiotus metropolitanus]